MGKVCAQCENFIGFGDWGLSCSKMYGITSESSSADDCHNFVQETEFKNASRIVSGFRCSICGEFEFMVNQAPNEPFNHWLKRAQSLVVDECPFCGAKSGDAE